MTAEHYRKLNDDELVRRYKSLNDDTSCQTTDDELRRQFAMQEIGVVLNERELWSQVR
jgi:hypothetical protein